MNINWSDKIRIYSQKTEPVLDIQYRGSLSSRCPRTVPDMTPWHDSVLILKRDLSEMKRNLKGIEGFMVYGLWFQMKTRWILEGLDVLEQKSWLLDPDDN